jgi:DNA invertase Pin-like site-specific DNA recombinase
MSKGSISKKKFRRLKKGIRKKRKKKKKKKTCWVITIKRSTVQVAHDMVRSLKAATDGSEN